MCDALGIVSYDDFVDLHGLSDHRPIPSISFMGRYRLIDFVLSNMTNSGISDIQVYVKHKPRSVIEHLGSGRQYNINSKSGRLRILTGEEHVQSEVYNHDITAYMQNIQFVEKKTQPYVIIAPSYMVYKMDFNEALNSHIASKADITMLYKTVDNANTSFTRVDTLALDKSKVSGIEKNVGKFKNRHISLSTYIMSRELFIHLVYLASNTSSMFTLRDIIIDQLEFLNVQAYPLRNYLACINTFEEYYRVSMELINHSFASTLFSKDWPIYTQTNDSCPTQYTAGAKVSSSIIANNAYIDGELRNCVIGRGVIIKKGAVVEDSIILAEAIIEENSHLKNVIIDKHAHVKYIKELIGEKDKLIYVSRMDTI